MRYLLCLLLVTYAGQAVAQQQAIETQTSNLIERFFKWSSKDLDLSDKDPLPEIRVAVTPNLIFINFEKNQITVPYWKGSPAPLKDFLNRVALDGDGKTLFTQSFNQFFVAHEAAHWLQHQFELFDNSNLYQVEQHANRVAVEFWLSSDVGQNLLSMLLKQCEKVLSVLQNPTPVGESPIQYFTENYEELAKDPSKYGYFQFYFVKKAIEEESQYTLRGLMSQTN